jgi:hypothetical protein
MGPNASTISDVLDYLIPDVLDPDQFVIFPHIQDSTLRRSNCVPPAQVPLPFEPTVYTAHVVRDHILDSLLGSCINFSDWVSFISV